MMAKLFTQAGQFVSDFILPDALKILPAVAILGSRVFVLTVPIGKRYVEIPEYYEVSAWNVQTAESFTAQVPPLAPVETGAPQDAPTNTKDT
jgi:hypothetical protein